MVVFVTTQPTEIIATINRPDADEMLSGRSVKCSVPNECVQPITITSRRVRSSPSRWGFRYLADLDAELVNRRAHGCHDRVWAMSGPATTVT